MAAQAHFAALTDERASSRAQCAELQLQLDAMQKELQNARAMMTEHQGCKDPERQFPGQGCKGQPSGMGEVPLGSGVLGQKAGNFAINHQSNCDYVDFAPQLHVVLLPHYRFDIRQYEKTSLTKCHCNCQ